MFFVFFTSLFCYDRTWSRRVNTIICQSIIQSGYVGDPGRATHFGGSRRWANPCTFRGIWLRIRCSGHPGERCPRVDPRTRSSRSGKRPSTAGNYAESCWKSGRSSPAAFSCRRAFSAWQRGKGRTKQFDMYWAAVRQTWPPTWILCILYQFFVVECGPGQNWRQTGIALRRRHRLKSYRKNHRNHYCVIATSSCLLMSIKLE